jgi:two-component system response regulator NreC
MSTQPTIVLADDHTVVRHGLRLLLERDGAMEVLAEAADADAALRYVRGHKPDVLVLDLNMPGRDSLEIIPEVAEASPDTRVVVLTMQSEPSFARAALRAGAAGYVLKDAADAILIQAIDSARTGQTFVDPTVGARLAAEPLSRDGHPDGLSDREVDVLRLLALGHTNAEAAHELGISVRTVETHRSHIQQKTGLGSRSQLVRYAQEHQVVG